MPRKRTWIFKETSRSCWSNISKGENRVCKVSLEISLDKQSLQASILIWMEVTQGHSSIWQGRGKGSSNLLPWGLYGCHKMLRVKCIAIVVLWYVVSQEKESKSCSTGKFLFFLYIILSLRLFSLLVYIVQYSCTS